MLFLSCFCYAFVSVCLLMSCGHLLSLSHWYPGSAGMVLVCIDPDLCPLSYLNVFFNITVFYFYKMLLE